MRRNDPKIEDEQVNSCNKSFQKKHGECMFLPSLKFEFT